MVGRVVNNFLNGRGRVFVRTCAQAHNFFGKLTKPLAHKEIVHPTIGQVEFLKYREKVVKTQLRRWSIGFGIGLVLVVATFGCEPKGQKPCSSQADCLPQQQCLRGACQEKTTSQTPEGCKESNDCKPGESCEQGKCIPKQDDTVKKVCQPDQATCEGTTFRQCKSDGSGWTTTTCEGFHLCKNNKCQRKPPSAQCGNGVKDANEQCDDGNTRSGDGCSRFCLSERVQRFEPAPTSRELQPFILGSRVCRSETKRNSYKSNTDSFYVIIAPTVCRLNDRPVVTERTVKSHVAYLNQVFRATRLTFVMNPIKWETSSDNCEVFYERESSATLRRYSESDKIAVFYARNIYGGNFSIGGYANLSGVVVNASAYGMADILAHELGHSFGLDHPHACYHGKETKTNCKTAGDQLCDTPPDPGPRGVNGLDYCPDGTTKNGQCTVSRCRSISCPGGEKPFFKNLMSYYHCGSELTADQVAAVRCVAFNEQARRVSRKKPCQSSSGCVFPQTCQRNFCEGPTGCTNDSNCGSRQYCENRVCKNLAQGECRKDSHCSGGQVCRSNRCQQAPECYQNSDCPSGQICQNGSCKPAPTPQCQQHSDCPPRQYCAGGVCKALPTGECRANSDCTGNQICQQQKCVNPPPPPCLSDSDCGTNEVCRNSKCVTCKPDGQAASNDAECCSNERNDRSQCCKGWACCGPQNNSQTNSNGRCSCISGYEWENETAPRDFRCKKKQAPACKKDGESASQDSECCSKERNDQAKCCTGKACCGPQNNSQTLTNGNCQCITGYTWANPSDSLDFRCKQIQQPSCQKDGTVVSNASTCCSKQSDLLRKCCSGNNCCSNANKAQASSQNVCECIPGHVRIDPNNAQDLRCKALPTGSFHCTLQATLQGHTNLVRDVAISPDGAWVASASYDRTVKLWNLKTRTLARTFTGPTNAVMSIAFHPNSKELIAGGYDKSYRKWAITGQNNGSSQLFAPVRAVAYRPDGRQVATGTEKGIYVWGIPNGSGRGFASNTYIRGVAYSPDSKWMAISTKNKEVQLYNSTGSSVVRRFLGHTGHVFDVAWNANGTLLASVSASIKIWDPTKGTLLRTLNGHQRGIYHVGFHPTEKILFTSGEDGKINIWNPDTGQLLKSLSGHTGAVYTLDISRDGKTLATGSKDNTVKLWSCSK